MIALFGDPIVVRDGLSRKRSPATAVAVTVVLGAVGAVACTLFSLAIAGAPEHRPDVERMARVAYHAMSFQIALVMLVTPALAAGTIVGERERGTLDLLVLGGRSPASIVRAKAVATVSYVGLFVLAALPVYAAIFLHAGLTLVELALADLITLTSAFLVAGLGVFFSALCPHSFTAALAAVGLSLALCLDVVLAGVVPAPGTGVPALVVPPGMDAAEAAARQSAPVEAGPLRAANPLYAVHQVMAHPGGGRRPWRLAVVAHTAIGLLLLAAASRLVSRSSNW